MKTLIFSTAILATALIPTAASAQAVPAAIIAVVDLDKVTADCNACKAAAASLRSQVSGLETRQKALAAPLDTEGKSIKAAIDALQGKEPDAALQARIKAFQTKYQNAQEQASTQQQQVQRNQQYIQKQIIDKLGPIYKSVMERRGANIMVEVGATLAASSAVDVTADVLAGLNAALPSLVTTAPAEPTQKTPEGR